MPDEGGVVRAPHLVVAVPGEGHDVGPGQRARLREVGERALHLPVPPLRLEPRPPRQRLQRRHAAGHLDGQGAGRLRVLLGVQGAAAVELPRQQRPADALTPGVGAHPALEVHRQRVAEGRRGHHGRVRDHEARRVQHGQPVAPGVEAPPPPPLGDVLGVGVLAGVVELLGGGQQRGDGGSVVGLQRAGGEALGQLGEVGHGFRG